MINIKTIDKQYLNKFKFKANSRNIKNGLSYLKLGGPKDLRTGKSDTKTPMIAVYLCANWDHPPMPSPVVTDMN